MQIYVHAKKPAYMERLSHHLGRQPNLKGILNGETQEKYECKIGPHVDAGNVFSCLYRTV